MALALTPSGDAPIDAAPADLTEAQTLYAQAIEQLDRDDPAGVETLTRAANMGEPQAQLMLSALFQTGESGVEVDEAESRLWARRAAESEFPQGMHNYAMYLYEGVGGARNRPEALDWLKKAADRGMVDSQYNVARIYENGDEGIAPNLTQAYRWYLIAARAGDPQAQAAVDRLSPTIPAAARQTARAQAEAFALEPLA
jgi:localization factor PodJL